MRPNRNNLKRMLPPARFGDRRDFAIQFGNTRIECPQVAPQAVEQTTETCGQAVVLEAIFERLQEQNGRGPFAIIASPLLQSNRILDSHYQSEPRSTWGRDLLSTRGGEEQAYQFSNL
jgi:hypothetical protein